MQNAAEILSNLTKIELTLMYEATVKDSLPEWDRATPIIKK